MEKVKKPKVWTCFWSLLNEKDKDWVELALVFQMGRNLWAFPIRIRQKRGSRWPYPVWVRKPPEKLV